jgi:hypothetical protein
MYREELSTKTVEIVEGRGFERLAPSHVITIV